MRSYHNKEITKKYSASQLEKVRVDDELYKKAIFVIDNSLDKCKGENNASTKALGVLISEALIKLRAIPELENLIGLEKIDKGIINKIIQYLAENIDNDSKIFKDWRLIERIDNALRDESLTKYANKIIEYLKGRSNTLIEHLEVIKLNAIQHIVNHIISGTLDSDSIKYYTILEKNGQFLDCSNKYLNYNLFDLTAVCHNNASFALIMGRCNPNLLRLFNRDGLTFEDHVHTFSACDYFPQTCLEGYSPPVVMPKGMVSLMCSKYSLPGLVFLILESAASVLYYAYDIPLKVSIPLGAVGTALVNYTNPWISDQCKPYVEYNTIDSLNPNHFNSIKQIIKYLLDNSNKYARMESCYQNDVRKHLVKLPVYSNEDCVKGNTKLLIAICESKVIEEQQNIIGEQHEGSADL